MTKRWAIISVILVIFLCASGWMAKEVYRELWGSDNWTRLHSAAYRGDTESVRSLIADHADINAIARKAGTPLQLAANSGHVETAKVLLDSGADADLGCPLAGAALKGDMEMMTLLLDHGARPDGPASTWRVPLIEACEYDHLQAVRLLLKRGANVNACTRYNAESALERACYSAGLDVLELIIENGADVNHRDGSGRTALHYAAVSGRLGHVRKLLASGAARGIRDEEGKTPTDLALKNSHQAVADELAGKSTPD